VNGAVYYAIALTAGGTIAFQVVINTQLRQYVGTPMYATFCSLAVGAIAALTYCLVVRSPVPVMADVARAPWWCWLGGFIGVYFLWCSVVVSPRLGVSATLGLVIVGQITASIIIDHFGLLGAQVRSISPGRLIGVACMAIGVSLIAYYRE